MSPWLVVLSSFFIVASASAVAAENNGIIRGQVKFTGSAPPQQPLRIGGDRFCEEVNSESPILQEEVVVNPNQTLKNVVIWIASGGPDNFKPKPQTSTRVTLTQQSCSFYPRVLAMQVGQPLEMRNVDPTIHNINAIPRKNKRFNMAMIGGKTPPQTITFDKPEVSVKLRCDIHPWMVAWVAVFDHPLFAVSSEDGAFEISGLPPGEYVLKSWHEKLGTTSTEVLVKADEPAEVVFTYTNTGSASADQVEAPITTSSIAAP